MLPLLSRSCARATTTTTTTTTTTATSVLAPRRTLARQAAKAKAATSTPPKQQQRQQTQQAPPSSPTVASLLAERAASSAHRDAFHDAAQSQRWTWAELDRHVAATAHGLVEQRCAPGTSLVLVGANESENYVAQLAAARIGVRTTLLDSATASVDDVAAALVASDARALLLDGRTPTFAAAADALLPELASWPTGVPLSLERFPSLRTVVHTGTARRAGMADYASSLPWYSMSSSPPAAAADAAVDAAHTQATLLAAAADVAAALHLDASSSLCNAAGLVSADARLVAVYAALVARAKLSLPSSSFAAEHTLATLASDQSNVLLASAAQLLELLASPRLARVNTRRVEHVVCVGGNAAAVDASALRSAFPSLARLSVVENERAHSQAL